VIHRPIIECIFLSNLLIRPYIIRPGTFKALLEHLDEKEEGFYHIIHLDMHGSVQSYKQIKNNPEYIINNRFGLPDITEFEGERAFLSFESGKEGKSILVEAKILPGLVRDKRIPVCFLNACQSAKQTSFSQGDSLSKLFSENGIQMVIGMRYNASLHMAMVLFLNYSKVYVIS